MLHDLAGLEPKLPLHVDRGRREEDVDPRAAGAREGLGCGVDVLGLRAAERRDGGALGGIGDRADALEVSGRRDGEPRLDHVDPEALELLRDLDLLVGRKRDPRRLLAVAQRGVEHRDPAAQGGSSFSP